jgi:Flp pilus assembly protein TadB
MFVAWTFLAVFLLLIGLYELVRAPRRRVQQLLQSSTTLWDHPNMMQEEHPLRRAVHWGIQKLRPWLPGAQLASLREQLLWAGQPMNLNAEEFIFLKCAVGLLGGLVGYMAFDFAGAVGGFGLGYLIPMRMLDTWVAERSRKIRIDLPHFIQLLTTALEAGLPIIDAVRRVSAEAPGLLAAEMGRTIQEMAAGKAPAVAWQHLSARTNCQELRDVVTTIVQSQEYGVSIAEQLRFQMRTTRKKKQQEAEEKAQAASVKMRLPTILFIMVPTMVVLMGPAAVSVLRTLRGG